MDVFSDPKLWWWLLSATLIVIGLLGTVLPVLPGTLFILAGIVLGAWIDDFTRIGPWTLGIVSVLALLAWLTDYVAALFGAKRAGASPLALFGAAIGSVVGIFSGLVGLLFMPLLGAMLGEWIAVRNSLRATKVGLATWLGMLIGTVIKLALSFLMLGIFLAMLFF
ncbi:MAG: DUF456 domain-containing protein [Betaproteobacteria bacterium]|nr:DUF456 domain-containing protein [Betaproteobacteria bacterium]